MAKKILGNKANKIFLTGGAGFIGSHLCDLLLEQDYFVTVFDNFSNGRREFIEHNLSNKNFNLIFGDCNSYEELKKAMKSDHDLVWHLAANTDIIKSHLQPDRDLKDCAISTFNVLEAMRTNNIKNIIFASTGAVYGKLCLDNYTSEKDGPLMPMSTYGAGKIASEAFIQAYSHLYDINSWIFRFGNVIGSRATHGVILDFIKKLKNNPNTLRVLGDGSQEKNYFLVKECLEGMAWTFLNTSLDKNNPSIIFNLGTSDVTNVMEIAKIVIEEMGLKDHAAIEVDGSRYAWLGDQPKVHLNVDKVNLIGWTCKLSSSESVRIAVRQILNEV